MIDQMNSEKLVDEYPTSPTVEFTEDDWNTVHRGYIVESSTYSHLVIGHGYGRFWIPKCYVRHVE